MTKRQDIRVELYKDLIFRAIFGRNDSEEILKPLLNAVMEEAKLPLIEKISIKNPFDSSDIQAYKDMIMDVYAVDQKGRRIDIEMQLQHDGAFADRLLYYGARLFRRSLKKKEKYRKLPRVICIAFVNFPIGGRRSNVWFDKWRMHSLLGTGLGSNKLTNIFVRLPRVLDKETTPEDKFGKRLASWVKILSSYEELTDEEKKYFRNSTEGFDELERRVDGYFQTEEGKKVFDAQAEFEGLLGDIRYDQYKRYKRERKARIIAERRTEEERRGREEERRGREEERRGREEAKRGREEAERGREEAERELLESQKRSVVRIFRSKFGIDPELPTNWAVGRSYDDLETLADNVFASTSLEEALALFQ